MTRDAAATLLLCAAGVVVIAACSSSEPPGVEPAADSGSVMDEAGGPAVDASDAATAPDAFKPSGKCAATFGSALTAGFGRADGRVWAVQKPSDTMCVFPNRDHVIVQVLINGSVYRMVVNVESTRSGVDPKIRVGVLPHALPAPAFAEGWHLGAELDYVATLGAHSGPLFAPLTLDEAVAKIAAEVTVGDAVAVYAESGVGRPESAHLVHRNKTNRDGAIVVSPASAPRFLLFHFENQTF